MIPTPFVDGEAVARAMRTVAANAYDADDARVLLIALGLIEAPDPKEAARLAEAQARLAWERQIAAERQARREKRQAELDRLCAEIDALREDPAAMRRRRFQAWRDGPEHAEIRAAFARATPDLPSVTERRRYELNAAIAAERRTA